MEGTSPALTRTCVSCGRSISFDANVCPYCGHDYRTQAYTMAPPPQRTALPAAGGALILVAGLLAIIMGVFYLALDPADLRNSGATLPPEVTDADLKNIVNICGSMCLIFGVIAIVGGFFGLMRKHFALGVVGGIFGILGLGFLIGALLALIGLILVVVARKEFS